MKNLMMSNVNLYQVTDMSCEYMLYQAKENNISQVLLGAATIPKAKEFLGESNIEISATVAYPSGCYFADAKVEEIEELKSLYPYVKGFYAVISEGRFLSEGNEVLAEELAMLKKAASDKELHIITEIASLGDKAKDLIELCKQHGVKSIVATTGFAPYAVSFASVEQLKQFKKLAGEYEVKLFAIEDIEELKDCADTFIINHIKK